MKYSGIQSENIRKYAKSKLLLLVYEGLYNQIGKLIEESEHFFERLPETLNSLKREGETLLTKHDNNIEPAVSYVLAESKFKKLIYQNDISVKGTVFFPEDMSAQIYRTMFDTTYNALQRNRRTIELSDQEKEKLWKAQLEADLKVFRDVLDLQETTLRKESEYARMNVISALRDEADLAISNEVVGDERENQKFAYMQLRFRNLRNMAVTRGADNINTTVNRPINSWGSKRRE